MNAVLFDKKTQEDSLERRYFITNMPTWGGARIAHAIRSHWIVENGLHWTLDVVFDEDRSRKRVGNAAENYSRLMRVIMNLLKKGRQRPGFDKPLIRKRKLAAWNTSELERILFDLPSENNSIEHFTPLFSFCHIPNASALAPPGFPAGLL